MSVPKVGETFVNSYGVIEKGRVSGVSRRGPALVDKLDRIYACHHRGLMTIDPKYTHVRVYHPCVPEHGLWEFQLGMELLTVGPEFAGQEFDVIIPVTFNKVYMTQQGMAPIDAPTPTIQLLTIEDEEV